MSRRKGRLWLYGIAFVLLLGCALYPLVSTALSQSIQSRALGIYTQQVREEDEKWLRQEWDKARDYNERLSRQRALAGGAYNLNEPQAGYEEVLNWKGHGIMGYLRIPSLELVVPVYHRTDGEELGKGAGHMPGTSVPVGGAGTHAVLAAHSGDASQKLFSDLDKMVEGDLFYLDVLNETLVYRVDDIRVVLPSDTSALAMEEGQDRVTLLTCTPYGVNSHRLLVRGTRVRTPRVSEEIRVENTSGTPSTWMEEYRKGVELGLCCALSFVAVPVLVRSIRRAVKGGKNHTPRGKHIQGRA